MWLIDQWNGGDAYGAIRLSNEWIVIARRMGPDVFEFFVNLTERRRKKNRHLQQDMCC
jgi:hypothetical protein